jgi:DnaJ-class molecular chaperone
MATRNYYALLGISATASTRDIQEAFRTLAKRLHPDLGGEQDAPDFREVLEAYQILSDPERRRRYNQAHRFIPSGPAAPAESSVVDLGLSPEPLVPEPMSVRRDFHMVRPSGEALVERFRRNFTGLGIPKGERLESLSIEVVLSAEEAQRGGSLRIAVPVFYPCPACEGAGRDWLFPCLYCSEQGLIEEETPVRITIPPRVRDGTQMTVPIQGLSIHNLYLRLSIRVGP